MLNGTEETSIQVAEGLQLVSEIAQQRQRDAQATLDQALPAIVLAIERSEVVYTIEPRMLPVQQIDFSAFEAHLRRHYGLTFSISEGVSNIVMVNPSGGFRLSGGFAEGEVPLNSEQVAKLALDMPTPSLSFENGRFPISKHDFVPITGVTITRECIHVMVEGKSRVADLVVMDVAEALWASAGVPKQWDQIASSVQLISYGTATKVDLGFSAKLLLNRSLRDFIANEMIEGNKYAAYMGSASARHAFKPAPSTATVFSLDELHIMFHRFDTQTGRSERSVLRFSVRTRDEQGTGILVATSELPFDVHVACLTSLVEAVSTSE